jgi:hypothetical protein
MFDKILDINENGIRDATEEFKDFNVNGTYDAADGLYNGVLCDASVAPGSTPTACNTQKSIHVRKYMPVVFSGSNPVITIANLSGITPVNLTNPLIPVVELPACVPGFTGTSGAGAAASFVVRILDVNGNAMPAGTTVAFSTTNGKLLSPTDEFVQPSTAACRTGGTCPASAAVSTFGDHVVTMKSDATYDKTSGDCSNTEADGVLKIKITTPNKLVTPATVSVTD